MGGVWEMRIGCEFYFDSSHYLPDYKGKCERLHGHTYKLEVVIEDAVREDGMVMDFNLLKKTVKEEVIEGLDHMKLNDVLDNPTAENIVEWIIGRLRGRLPLYSIKLWEGNGKWVERLCA
jgi:6-pyruvoyltetrahydropterin/6-carboxytetrahydropterin synthase